MKVLPCRQCVFPRQQLLVVGILKKKGEGGGVVDGRPGEELKIEFYRKWCSHAFLVLVDWNLRE